MLELRGVEAGYGRGRVLHGLSLRVQAGEIVTLLGRNGMGKTTTLRAILGLAQVSDGDLLFAETSLRGRPTHRIAQLGIGLVPEGREIFPTLTVEENLVLAARTGAWTRNRIYALFPALAERRGHWGHQLSGGEAQMLAIGRALMTQPRLILMDEATEGLSPMLRDEIWRVIAELKSAGLSILLVDKNVRSLLGLADRHYVLSKGRVVFEGDSEALRSQLESLHQTLAI
jgi:branched-chain amino acid transport system ATP-binding protein